MIMSDNYIERGTDFLRTAFMTPMIWLDDIRPAPDNTYFVCRSYEDFIDLCSILMFLGKSINFVDFDHDLGTEKTGYDVAKYIVENNIPVDCFSVHSSNSVGKDNIEQLLTHYGYTKL